MNYFKVVYLALVLSASPYFLFSQSTKDLFSIPGLNIAAFQYDDTGGEHASGYSYLYEAEQCGYAVSVFVNNENGSPMELYFDGGKVYRLERWNCELTLYYDFELQVGEVMPSGRYLNFEVTSVDEITLLNGQKRKSLQLKHGAIERLWIEGIGDVREGFEFFTPFMGYSFYGPADFICAKINEELIWIRDGYENKCVEYGCPNPFPFFEVLPDGLTVGFFNNSFFGEEYTWDFGDGSGSTDANAVHEYAIGGCYDVVLTASSYCSGPQSQTNAVQICIEEPWKEISPVPENATRLSAGPASIAFWHAGEVLNKSMDDGKTWEQLTFPTTAGVQRSIQKVAMYDAEQGIAVCTNEPFEGQPGIFVTNDGGLSWSAKGPLGNSLYHVVAQPTGQAWSFNLDLLLYSEDFGNNWTSVDLPVGLQLTNLWPFDDKLYARFFSGSEIFLGTSTDAGNSWTTALIAQDYWDFVLADEQTIYAYKYGLESPRKLFKSIDQGQTWLELLADINIRSISFADADHGWVAEQQGSVHYTSDGGQTFTRNNCGLKILLPIMALSPDKALAIRRVSTANSDDLLVRFDTTFPPLSCLDVDLDNDGFFTNSDCDDDDPAINPDAIDIPDNGIDEDCNGADLVSTYGPLSSLAIQVFPNPAQEQLHILSSANEPGHWRLRSVSGALLRAGQLQSQTVVDVSSLAAGVYVLEVVVDAGMSAERVVVE